MTELTARIRAKINLINLAMAYKACFTDAETGELTKAGERVLRDLGNFSKLTKSPLRVSSIAQRVDTHATCVAIGRTEPVKRIWDYLKMDPYQHPIMKEPNDE